MTQKIRVVRVQEYGYYVNQLRWDIGFETWVWRQIVTSQTAHTKYKWPPCATEWNPPMEIFTRTPLILCVIALNINYQRSMNRKNIRLPIEKSHWIKSPPIKIFCVRHCVSNGNVWALCFRRPPPSISNV